MLIEGQPTPLLARDKASKTKHPVRDCFGQIHCPCGTITELNLHNELPPKRCCRACFRLGKEWAEEGTQTMTAAEHEQIGFDRVSTTLASIQAGSSIGAYHRAHEMWCDLESSGESSYSNGCYKACRLYFHKSWPDQKILRQIRIARREANGM